MRCMSIVCWGGARSGESSEVLATRPDHMLNYQFTTFGFDAPDFAWQTYYTQ